jgi:hypothetical protein
MVPATLEEVAGLQACSVCHPEKDPKIQAAIKTATVARDERRAAEAATAARARAAKAERDRSAALSAKAAADSKAAAAAEERRRLETEPIIRLTNARLRPVIVAAVAGANNDVAVFDQKFRAAVLALAPDYSGPVSIVDGSELTVTAIGPVGRMHWAAREAVRKFNPMPTVPWTDELQILISPSRIDSPDIEKVIVERNGVAVAPLRSNLIPRELTTAMGGKARLRAGDVVFPLAAFNNGPGVVVKITLVPASGTNIVRSFNSIALRGFQ